MKKLRVILPLVAFVFAISSAFSSRFVPQIAYFDSNGTGMDGGDSGPIDNTLQPCVVQAGNVCTIDGHYAFNSEDNAVANADAQNEFAEGLLKYQE